MTSLLPVDDVCLLDKDSGPCQDPLTQWFYDYNEGECRRFTFGGCRGNGNRFNTKSDCERRCRPVTGQLITSIDARGECGSRRSKLGM